MPSPAGHLPLGCIVLGVLWLAVVVTCGIDLIAGPPWCEPVAEAARVAAGASGLVAAVRAARSTMLPARLRQAWGALAIGFGLLAGTAGLLLASGSGDTSPWGDATHAVFVVALLVALQRFPPAPAGGRDRVTAAVDALTVAAGGAVVLWYISIGPLLERSEPSAGLLVTAVVHPLGDLLLVFGAVQALRRGAGGPGLFPLRLLIAGALVLFVGDAVHGYLGGHAAAATAAAWQFLCWNTAYTLVAAAATAQGRTGLHTRGIEWCTRDAGRFLPLLAVTAAQLTMLAGAGAEDRFFPWGGLTIGAAVLSVLLLVRQALTQRESDQRALHDELTGLGNRLRFRQACDQAISQGFRTGRPMGLLVIDMNGFQQLNDALGHRSGDRVLAEFAAVLRRCVHAPGLAARLGGDEFAVVLPDIRNAEEAYDVAGRIAASLGPVLVGGRLVTLTAGIGVAVAAPGTLTHDEIVHRACLAMAKAKSLGPQTRWAIWQESLEPPAAAGEVAEAA